MADYILYSVVKFFAVFFRMLPLRLSLWIGRRFGDILYCSIGKRKAVAYANLKAAFRGRYTSSQLRKIIRDECYSLSQSFIEVLKFPLLGNDYIDRYIKVEGEDKIKAALKRGHGIILLTAHFGNWELSSLVGGIKDYKMNVLVRWQKFDRLNGYLNKMRGSKGANVISKDDARERIEYALNNNEVAGILSDQDGGKRGEFVEFFGRLASTPKGVAHFSLKTGAPILPVFIVREKGPYHRIIIEDDISVNATEVVGKDIHEILQRFAKVLQKYVEGYPGQWLWLHKRWKSTPTKFVLVLSDGKAGHLKQSLSVANAMKERRAELGYKERDTKLETLEVRFKSRFARAIFDPLAILGFNLHQLLFCFSPETVENIQTAYADFVISCGSSLAGVNLSLKKEFNAKSVVIMRSNIYNINKYDLAIIPAHDRPKQMPNVVVTRGAVADSDKELLGSYGSELKKHVNVTKDNVMGILIGGDSKAYIFSPELINSILDAVMLAADDLDADILLTTSRRTSSAVEETIKARLRGSTRVKLLLIANEYNFEGAIEGILGLSNILIVSGESIAMVSEAVNSGKRVLVFMPHRKSLLFGTKQEKLVKNLEAQHRIVVSSPVRLRTNIRSLVKKGLNLDIVSDTDLIRAALGKII
ncbi:MAG: hypothetical protein AMJ78_07975 [Omnitrophica WOR_2 bacterium SM23_29]|nr:MAG: hypothetical protein AMJ78_07975 [Omnitrophica WOR_2 bacterium SM23_29]